MFKIYVYLHVFYRYKNDTCMLCVLYTNIYIVEQFLYFHEYLYIVNYKYVKNN